jgi:hypothetical protein
LLRRLAMLMVTSPVRGEDSRRRLSLLPSAPWARFLCPA